MKKIVRILAGMLAALMLAGCRTAPEIKEEETAEVVEVLTHVFQAAEDILLPEGYWVYGIAETTADSVTLLLRKSVKDGETGIMTFYNRPYTAFADGREPVIGEEITGKCCGYLESGGKTYLLMGENDNWDTYHLQEYTDGVLTGELRDLQRYLSDTNYFQPERMFSDPDGNLYVCSIGQVLVVQPDLSGAFGVGGMNRALDSVSMDKDGVVWVSYDTSTMMAAGETYIAAIDPAVGGLTKEQRIGSADTVYAPMLSPYDDRYTVYYIGADGVYGRSAETGEDVLLLHFSNSGLNRGTVQIIPMTGDTMFVMNTKDQKIPGIYTRRPDISLTTNDILYLFMNNSSQVFIDDAVLRFNEANPGKRVVIKNYFEGDDLTAGDQKMVMEIETGLAQPDLILGSPWSDAIRYMVEKGRFLDLFTFMENDPVINRDNVFGIVQRFYSYDGKLFAIPGSMALNTLLVSRETAAGQTSWSVEDVMDLVENLPAGTVYKDEQNREKGLVGFLSTYGYHNFVDLKNGTAFFDTDTFRRVLTYMDSLQTAEAGDEIAAVREGRVKTLEMSYYLGFREFLTTDLYFPDGHVRIGYPTRYETSLTMLGNDGILLISDTCENPNLAWEFLREYVLQYKNIVSYANISPVKSLFREALRTEIQNDTWFRLNTGRTVVVRGELDPDGSYKGNKGQLVTITDAQAEEIMGWLDNTGVPVYDVVLPEEITDLVNEEISAFLAGANTVDGCAKAIQSRVEIWLAERS